MGGQSEGGRGEERVGGSNTERKGWVRDRKGGFSNEGA